MRAMKPRRGFGWMAGAVGLLVAGRLVRRRTRAALPEPSEASDLEPASWAPTALEAQPAWALEEESASSTAWSLTHEDMAPCVDDEMAEARPDALPPRIRRGPSGREHYWLES